MPMTCAVEAPFSVPFMAFIGRNACNGADQYLHFDGELSRIVEVKARGMYSADDLVVSYRDALRTETPFLAVGVTK